MKQHKYLACLLCASILFAGCSKEMAPQSSTAASAVNTQVTNNSVSAELFTDRDMRTEYSKDGSTCITLSGDTASSNSNAAVVSGSTVTITDEGTYILSGSMEGMVIINADKQDKIQLVLDGASIHSPTSAAIYILEADKVFLTTAEGTENVLSNGGTYTAIDDNNIDAALFSKADLTLNGEGTLTIQADAGHGVVSKDDLVITSGSYVVTAESHGLSGKDCLNIAGGSFQITSGKDALHAEHNEDSSLGSMNITGGNFLINAQGDGISTSSNLLIQNGTFQITSGGGTANAPVSSRQDQFWYGNRGDIVEAQDADSTKAIKAASFLDIQDGTFVLDSADDALHSNGDLEISGGSFSIAAGDDGIHADNNVTISAGDISISQSYEGIEGLSIDLLGGNIVLTASDDGLNAAGGKDSSGFGGRGGDMFRAEEGAYITISEGTLHINASGDGIDSNGDFTVTGGETYVSGPTNSGNGTLDYAGNASISGGLLIGAGSSGMAQNFGSSTQGVIMVNVSSSEAGSEIVLCDSNGNTLINWTADKNYSSVILSSPDICTGNTYVLTTNGESMEIAMEDLMYNSSLDFGNFTMGHGDMGEPGGKGPNGRGHTGSMDGMGFKPMR